MPLDNRFAYIQPKPESNTRTCLHFDPLHPVETFPNALLLSRWQSRALVVHRYTSNRPNRFQGNGYGLIHRRIFESIDQIISHHLPNAVSIRFDRYSLLDRHLYKYRARRIYHALLLDGLLNNNFQVAWF